MGIFDFLSRKKAKDIPVVEPEEVSKEVKEVPKTMEASSQGKATVKGSLTPKKKNCKHDFRLHSVGSQRLVACKDCGKRESNRDFIDLNIARLVKQD